MLYEELDDRFGRRKKRTVIFGMAGGTPPTPPTPPTPSALEEKDLNFYDFEGTLVASYDADEIAGLTELPEAPDHSADEVPLTFEEWNWTLEDIKGYFVSLPTAIVDVGATYHPTDGKTHAFFVVENDNDPAGVYLRMIGPATVDWGDGNASSISSQVVSTLSHVYARRGRYHCVIEGSYRSLEFTEYDTYSMVNSKVTEIYVSSTQTSIGSQFARNAYNLEKVTIPSSATTIDAYCFYSTKRLRTCVLPKGVTTIGFDAFSNSRVEKVSLPSTLTSLSSDAFSASNLLRITLPPRLETIGNNAFQYCRTLRNLSWTDSVILIGNRAFEETNLLEVRMPANASLGTHIFRGAPSLRKVTLSDTATTIPTSMLSSCNSLQKADIPASVTEMGGSVFGGSAYSFSVIRVYPTTPPTLGNSTVFTQNIKKIYVPAESVEAYKSATNWSNYAEKIEAIPA